MKHLVLLGGGRAHVHVLAQLARSPLSGVEATLVSPQAGFIEPGMLAGWLAGRGSIEDCSLPVAALAEAAGARRIEAPVGALRADAKQLVFPNGEALAYDVLSIDTEPAMDRDLIPGAREHALFVRPIEHFVRLSTGLLELAGSRPLSIVLIGGGAAGFELSLALQYRLGERVRVSLVTGGTPPLPDFPDSMQARATAALRRGRVAMLQERCVEITPTQVLLANGARLACDAPLAVWGASPAPWLAGSGLALDDGGFIQAQASLQSVSHPEVFAAPDSPKGGRVLFENLRRCLDPHPGRALRAFDPPARPLRILACGGDRALASWGGWSAEGAWVRRWKAWLDQRWMRRHGAAVFRD